MDEEKAWAAKMQFLAEVRTFRMALYCVGRICSDQKSWEGGSQLKKRLSFPKMLGPPSTIFRATNRLSNHSNVTVP